MIIESICAIQRIGTSAGAQLVVSLPHHLIHHSHWDPHNQAISVHQEDQLPTKNAGILY